MINTKTNKFLDDLTRLVNECGLPPVNVRLALDTVRLQLMALERDAMIQEQAAEKAKQKEKAGD